MKTTITQVGMYLLAAVLGLSAPGCETLETAQTADARGYGSWCLETGMVPVKIDEYIVHDYNLGTTHGLFIFSVEPESPAAVAGIREHDVLKKIGDIPIVDKDSFITALNQLYSISKYIPVVFQRGATLHSSTMRLP